MGRNRLLLAVPVAAVALAAAGCEGRSPAGGPEETIPPELFVETYVELRAAALRGDGTLPEEERDRILSERGITAEDLLEFARVRGGDPAFMSALWDTVEARVQALLEASAEAGEEGTLPVRPVPGGAPARGVP